MQVDASGPKKLNTVQATAEERRGVTLQGMVGGKFSVQIKYFSTFVKYLLYSVHSKFSTRHWCNSHILNLKI